MRQESALGANVSLLGFVRADRAGVELELGPPQQRAVLALLAAGAGRPVALTAILDALWSGAPPAAGANVVHRHISALRQIFEPNRPARTASRFIARAGAGYRLVGPLDRLDLVQFRQHVERAAALAADGALDAALREYRAGLDLWQDRAALGIDQSVRAHPLIASLDREWVAAARAAADLALALGTPEDVLDVIAQVAETEPLDQPVHARLMRVLAATGERAAALNVYADLRARLRHDLGIAPGAELEEAHREVLATPGASTRAGGTGTRPAQLPADLPGFTGRTAEIALLNAMSARPGAIPPVVISGPGGVGKSALAIHWAHQNAAYYPDGQLYADLRDAGGRLLPDLLTALGVPAEEVPADPAAQAERYASRLAGRRMIIVIDNAEDDTRVRPLLPAGPGCVVLVTSRAPLPGLTGASPLTLGVLPADHARALLLDRLGHARVSAEPEAAERLITLSGRLPLALAVITARAAANPGLRLTDVADEITATAPEVDLRAVLTWSYRSLPAPAARLFRRLAAHPGPDVSAATAAALAGAPVREVQALLADLVRAHLVGENHPGLYTVHDVIRANLAETP